MVYTGEAYNFTELRRGLVAAGHSFETSSDTEVVLRGYLQWGGRPSPTGSTGCTRSRSGTPGSASW